MRILRARFGVAAAALTVAACAALAGCADLMTGSGGPVASAPIASGPVQSGPFPAGAAAAGSMAPAGARGRLGARLVPAPAGSRPWSGSWGHTEHPSMAQFLQEFYRAPQRTGVATTLAALHVEGIAHRAWVAADGNQIDMVLLSFATPSGAAARFSDVTAATAAQSNMTAVGFGAYGRREAQGFVEAGLDPDGFVRARVYAHPARSVLLVEAFYFSPHRFARADLDAWTEAQLARLR